MRIALYTGDSLNETLCKGSGRLSGVGYLEDPCGDSSGVLRFKFGRAGMTGGVVIAVPDPLYICKNRTI